MQRSGPCTAREEEVEQRTRGKEIWKMKRGQQVSGGGRWSSGVARILCQGKHGMFTKTGNNELTLSQPKRL